MRNETVFEWDYETTFVNEDGETEILDHNHADKLQDLKHFLSGSEPGRFVLIRETGNDDDGVNSRQWAYPVNNVLPDEFDEGARVPVRFKKEWQRFTEQAPEE